jgi:hypothetical protein
MSRVPYFIESNKFLEWISFSNSNSVLIKFSLYDMKKIETNLLGKKYTREHNQSNILIRL